jgi:GT2 family glycosyltransferase
MGASERDRERMLEAGEPVVPARAYRAHAILVAGMHRSGTSAITRVLGLLGIDLPRHLAPGVAGNNDLGFWESVPVAEAHDRFFASIGSTWDDVSPIPRTVFSSTKAQEFAAELETILGTEYGGSTLFVAKDPRLCRLIPVWVAALERLEARPSFVITTRNPLEVAGSLKARDGFSATKSCLLWLRHVLDAERNSRGFPRVFVSYEHLLRDWVSTMDRVARELKVFWPRADHEARLKIEDFLSSALRHHSFDYSELQARSDINDWVKQVFEAVSRAATDVEEVDSELLDGVRGQLDRADQAYGPLLAQARNEVRARETARDKVESQLTTVAGELAERHRELNSLRTDNQLVTGRLVEEIETVALLQRVVDELAKALDELARGFGDAAAELLAAEGGGLMFRAPFERLLDTLRQRATLQESNSVRHAVDRAIGRIDEFLQVVDDDRARLLAALAERNEREVRQSEESKTLEVEVRRVAGALAEREAELAEALRRAEDAEADAVARAGALQRLAQERDELAAEGSAGLAQLSEAVSEQEELLVERKRENEALRTEGQHLASALADSETQLADALLRLDSASDEATQLREALAGRESTLAETLARLEITEAEATGRQTSLERALAQREAALSDARALVEATEAHVRSTDAALGHALSERDVLRAESKQLSDELGEREAGLASLRESLAMQGAQLDEQRRELEEITASSAAAAADLRAVLTERDTELGKARARLEEYEAEMEAQGAALVRADADKQASRADSERLQAALTELNMAVVAAQAESDELRRIASEHEERLEETLDEARKLAVALAEREEALSYRSADLGERDEQLLASESELAARDELLARSSEQLETLFSVVQVRDEKLAGQSDLLALLNAIGRARGRRWRSFSQFCSWLFPPTTEHLGYVREYLRLRGSDQFDPNFYLSRYLDVSLAGLNPLMHYIEHGRDEGRRTTGSPDDFPFNRTATLGPPPVATLALPQAVDSDTRLRRALAGQIPEAAMIAVATGGEERLLLPLADYKTCHFPRASDGKYAGNDASGNTALIANLEASRAAGTSFLYVPPRQHALLERNPKFRAHVLSRYSAILESEELGLCFALTVRDPANAWQRQLAELAEWIERTTGREASILDWSTGVELATHLPGCNVFAVTEEELPHLDGSVDVVAVASASEDAVCEARRVARHAVLEVPADNTPPVLTSSASMAEQAPKVSIVIPCHEQFAHTQACIRALDETLPTWSRGDILIVDDGSGAATASDLRRLAASNPHVTLLVNETNSGFVASVERAVQAAKGEFIVLLNNDTVPLPGWLPPLLAPFRTRDDVGAVGGRLVYPDGRLQEAGGLVFRDGSAAKYGYGDPDPDFPLFTVPREVDYCSGCLLAFPRDFYLESGGFDAAYGFGFYEDTDFCFRVRALGRVVLYEPESVVVHVEGASAGTDLTQGAKQFQARNASLFTTRWHEDLARQPERPEELDRTALQQLSSRGGGQ